MFTLLDSEVDSDIKGGILFVTFNYITICASFKYGVCQSLLFLSLHLTCFISLKGVADVQWRPI